MRPLDYGFRSHPFVVSIFCMILKAFFNYFFFFYPIRSDLARQALLLVSLVDTCLQGVFMMEFKSKIAIISKDKCVL